MGGHAFIVQAFAATPVVPGPAFIISDMAAHRAFETAALFLVYKVLVTIVRRLEFLQKFYLAYPFVHAKLFGTNILNKLAFNNHSRNVCACNT